MRTARDHGSLGTSVAAGGASAAIHAAVIGIAGALGWFSGIGPDTTPAEWGVRIETRPAVDVAVRLRDPGPPVQRPGSDLGPAAIRPVDLPPVRREPPEIRTAAPPARLAATPPGRVLRPMRRPEAQDPAGAAASPAAAQTIGPRILDNPAPRYPPMARRMGWEGLVVIVVKIGRGGEILSIRVEEPSGHACLDEAAREAIAAWRFGPARRGSEEVAGELEIPVRFRLER